MIPDKIARRVVHLSGVLLPLSYILLPISWIQFQYLVVSLLLFSLLSEVLRRKVDLPYREYYFRDYEQEGIAGYTMAIAGISVTVLLFDPEIALASMFMLFLGDPLSGLISSESLKRVKNMEALSAMFLVSLAAGLIFLPVTVAAAGALGATFADGVKISLKDHILDDNLTIPIYAGLMMTIATLIL